MEKQKFENTFSVITKEEDVKNLNHNIMPNTLVLEITHPFPGYYSNEFITSNTQPQTIFIVLREDVKMEFFYRKISRIKKYSSFSFHADYGEINIRNEKYIAIRVNPLENYEQIAILQRYLIDEGFLLKKPQKIEGKAVIKIFRFNNLLFENGIYHNLDFTQFVYFPISKELTWKLFEQITIRVRHNFQKKFDAALGVFFFNGIPNEVVRIFATDLSDDDINALSIRYNKEIENY